jgi:uncharacterized protein
MVFHNKEDRMSTGTVDTGKLCWFDFGTKDAKKAMEFYKQVLGWEFESAKPNYWMIKANGETIGALRKDEKFHAAQGFVSYFAVPSVKEGRTVITKAGGKLVGDTVAIDGNMGFFQLFTDIDGNNVAIWSQKP